jgi:hypothetical protein
VCVVRHLEILVVHVGAFALFLVIPPVGVTAVVEVGVLGGFISKVVTLEDALWVDHPSRLSRLIEQVLLRDEPSSLWIHLLEILNVLIVKVCHVLLIISF